MKLPDTISVELRISERRQQTQYKQCGSRVRLDCQRLLKDSHGAW